jgi:hypothetical protein
VASQAVSETAYFTFGLVQVAIKTPTHIHFHELSGHIHLTDIAMAGFTVQTCTEMWLVVEIYKIRLYVDPGPRNGFPTLKEAGNLLYLWVI